MIAQLRPRRVLIVAYPFPPMPSIGANRWDSMARHLRLLGHEVTVVTTSAFGRLRNIEEERHVERADDLTSVAWVRRALRRGPLPPSSETPVPSLAAPEAPLPDALRKIFVPDLYLVVWIPQALRLARRIVSEQRVDCVITTSPYESTHLLGPALQRRGPAWIADFRDGWSFERHRPQFPTAVQRELDCRIEGHIVRRADRVVTATRPIAEDFSHRLGVKAIQIANGFDPAKYRELPRPPLPHVDRDTVLLVHTGTLSGSFKDPRGLFAAMRRLSDAEPIIGRRLRLVIAGRLDTRDQRMLANSGVRDQIISLGELSHDQSLALQRHGDGLALITSVNWSGVTGKLFEYLSAGRPIIALAGSEVDQIVSRTCTGVTVEPDDVGAIATQLRRLVTGELAAAYHPGHLEPYVYPGPALRMAEVIEEALAHRGEPGSRLA